VLTLDSLCHADPSTLGKMLKRDRSDWPILSQTLQITNNKIPQIRSSQKQRKQLMFTCCLCQQDDEQGQTGAFCLFLINTVLKL